MKELSVIIPAFNEEAGISDVLGRLEEVLMGKFKYEVIVVDDGSSDKTGEVAKMAGVKVVRNPANAGYGRSLKRGIEAATHEYVAITDADGTYPLNRIPDLVEKLDQGFDMAVGARTGKHYWAGLFLNPARLVFKWLSEFVVGRRIPDVNSGLRVFRRSKVMPFFNDLSNRFSFTTSLTLIFILKGYFVCYLPIEYHARKGKSKVSYIHDAMRTLQIIFTIIAKYNPFKLFFAASLPILAATIVFLVFQLWLYAMISLYFVILLLLLGFFSAIFSK
ncbi:MAG: glycosyltransferase family 2 protein [Candidatus Harrisonbacteria bacterium]|nr:glycosyltransferase family 2 protein [Candidatus Harrisonbacteria bacterium]